MLKSKLHFSGEQPPSEFIDNGPSIPLLNTWFPKWCRKRWGRSARIHDWGYFKIRVMVQFADWLERRGGCSEQVKILRRKIKECRKSVDTTFRYNIQIETKKYWMARIFYRAVRLGGHEAIESDADPQNVKLFDELWDELAQKYMTVKKSL